MAWRGVATHVCLPENANAACAPFFMDGGGAWRGVPTQSFRGPVVEEKLNACAPFSFFMVKHTVPTRRMSVAARRKLIYGLIDNQYDVLYSHSQSLSLEEEVGRM